MFSLICAHFMVLVPSLIRFHIILARLLVMPGLVGGAGFHCRKDGNQAFSVSSLPNDVPDEFVLALLVVPDELDLEAIESLLPIHEAQRLTYLKLGGWKIGLLINFNVALLKQGIRRKVLGLKETENHSAASASSTALR